MLRRSFLVLAAVLLAPFAIAGVASAKMTGHLYVDGYDKGAVILRYPLQDGLPMSRPDLSIRGFGSAYAVARDGTLYTSRGEKLEFYAFAPNAVRPERSFEIPQPCQIEDTYLTGAAVDPSGNFWVTVMPFSQAKVRSGEGARRVPARCGAMAFSPHARGEVQPIQSFAPNPSYKFNYSLVIDNRADLFVDTNSDSGETVHEFGQIMRNPKVLRVYKGPYFNEYGTATAVDEADNFFVRTTLPDGNAGVAVWPLGADPTGPPASIVSDSEGRNLDDIAVTSGYLYTNTAGSRTIDVYHALQNGPQQPVFSLQISGYDFSGGFLIGP